MNQSSESSEDAVHELVTPFSVDLETLTEFLGRPNAIVASSAGSVINFDSGASLWLPMGFLAVHCTAAGVAPTAETSSEWTIYPQNAPKRDYPTPTVTYPITPEPKLSKSKFHAVVDTWNDGTARWRCSCGHRGKRREWKTDFALEDAWRGHLWRKHNTKVGEFFNAA